MLDTIKLTLDKTMFVILDKSKFMRDVMNSSRGYYSLVQNPAKKELLEGNYKPRLTLMHRFNCSGRQEDTLSIELSLPKLLFGNNFDELVDTNIDELVRLLMIKLQEMGVRVWSNVLINAPVSSIHYSKNISLIDGMTPHYIIGKIKEANMSASLDSDEANFRNDGYGYKWHTNSYELAFYDKVHDLLQAKKYGDKRSEENDNTLQLNLLDSLKQRSSPEVLRIEVRLNQRQKIGKLLRVIGIDTELTFQKLFSSSISQEVLLHYWKEIEAKRPRLVDWKINDALSTVSLLKIHNPKLSLLKCLELLGLKQILTSSTLRELRVMDNGRSDRSWYRLVAMERKINLPITYSPLQSVRDQLQKFEPLKLVDFHDKLINNDKYNLNDR